MLATPASIIPHLRCSNYVATWSSPSIATQFQNAKNCTKQADKVSLWYNRYGRVAIPVWINGTFNDGKGKLPVDGDKDLIVDYASFVPYVMAHLHPQAVGSATSFTSAERLEALSNRMIFMLPPTTRLSYYLSANYEEIQKKMVAFATEVIEPLGALDVKPSFPILRQLRSRRLVLL